MTIVADLHACLTTALGEAIPILLPEEIELPKAGRTPGQPGGIPAYLKQHPQGYVQIEWPQPITSDGLTGTFWVPVTSIAPPDEIKRLSAQVHRALCGWPYQPGLGREVTPAQPQRLSEGVWMVRPTFEMKQLDGGNHVD